MLKVCKILGIEPNKVFGYKNSKLYIDEKGSLIEKFSNGTEMRTLSSDLSELIEHSELIRKKAIQFTEREIMDAKDLRRLFLAKTIIRTDVLCCYDDDGKEAMLPYDLFPSIKIGETINILEII